MYPASTQEKGLGLGCVIKSSNTRDSKGHRQDGQKLSDNSNVRVPSDTSEIRKPRSEKP
jgi:hypothetical protein